LFLYQKTNRYFAQVADDIKDIAEVEIASLGGLETRPKYRGISFKADLKTLYRINYQSRLITRVLAPLIQFECHTERYLHKTASQIKWEDLLDPSMTFAVFSSTANSAIKHSKYAALCLKDAIVDSFKERYGRRPSIDTVAPDIWFNLHIENNLATISLDTSGGSLHRRGYRKDTVSAPMVETLAAAIIRYSGWDGSIPICDPLCGSGTLLSEAYMHAANIPAGVLRLKFGFEKMPDFDSSLWKSVKEEAVQKFIKIPKGLISGSDISRDAVRYSLNNLSAIDHDGVVTVEKRDVFDIEGINGKIIICNPPYGKRVGKGDDLPGFYKRFGDFLKNRCKGSTAYIYFGERSYLKAIGLRPSWKKPLSNGGLDGRLAKFEMY
jgi:putative N6-adenine-specific DNA methylase